MEEFLKHRRGQNGAAAAQLPRGDATKKAPSAEKSYYLFISWWAIMPGLVFWATLAVLCARECSALPWLAFGIGPAISAVLGIGGAVAYWIWALRLPPEAKRRARWLILSSVVWGPAVGLAGTAGVTMVLQMVFIAWSLLLRAGGSY